MDKEVQEGLRTRTWGGRRTGETEKCERRQNCIVRGRGDFFFSIFIKGDKEKYRTSSAL